jgi:hypothetical protein
VVPIFVRRVPTFIAPQTSQSPMGRGLRRPAFKVDMCQGGSQRRMKRSVGATSLDSLLQLPPAPWTS